MFNILFLGVYVSYVLVFIPSKPHKSKWMQQQALVTVGSDILATTADSLAPQNFISGNVWSFTD